MLYRTTITIACIFASCARPPNYVRECDRITKGFSEEFQKKYELVTLGQGGYFQNRKIDGFFVDFELHNKLDPNSAEKLLIDCVDGLIARINHDENISSYLTHGPMTTSDISISIGLLDEKNEPYEDFAQIHLYNNQIYFSSYDKEKKAYIAFSHEPYHLAIEKFQKSSDEIAIEE